MKKYTIENVNDFTYSLKINGENAIPIYKSLKKLLTNSVYYDSESSTLFFSAETILSFKEYLLNTKFSYKNCIKMIDTLTKQINILRRLGYGFYGFDITDIIVIDNIHVICSSEYLLSMMNDNIIIDSPINRPYFTSPEIIQLTTIPSAISHKCIYYSLGVLIIYCLLNTYLLVSNELKSAEEIDFILMPLYNTKIYWFIKRCLDENINKRLLLLI